MQVKTLQMCAYVLDSEATKLGASLHDAEYIATNVVMAPLGRTGLYLSASFWLYRRTTRAGVAGACADAETETRISRRALWAAHMTASWLDKPQSAILRVSYTSLQMCALLPSFALLLCTCSKVRLLGLCRHVSCLTCCKELASQGSTTSS